MHFVYIYCLFCFLCFLSFVFVCYFCEVVPFFLCFLVLCVFLGVCSGFGRGVRIRDGHSSAVGSPDAKCLGWTMPWLDRLRYKPTDSVERVWGRQLGSDTLGTTSERVVSPLGRAAIHQRSHTFASFKGD